MGTELDATKGWCCDGRTWAEHATVDGECCQPHGTDIDDLPPQAKAAAQLRLKRETPERP